MSVNLKSLVGKLTDTARRGLEGAAGLCLSRTHYDVELEHWFVKLLDVPEGDLVSILRHHEIAPDHVLADLNRALDSYKSGNGSRPQLSPSIEDVLTEAWIAASINLGMQRVRSGVILLAALENPRLRRRLVDVSPELRGLNADALAQHLKEIVAGTPEDREVMSGAATQPGATETMRPTGSATPALDQFTLDLTEAAQAGRLDPVLGRDREIRQIIDILMRRRQNNPILTGEAGVGKTAVVEGLALRIVAGDVPEPLRNVALRTLDLGLLQAGAGVKGEFENRLRQVIEEVQGSARPVVLFIDEAHALIGAGGQEGQGDAANLLKPALARGELRTIAATTWAEYKKYFEKDAALSRRFQVVKVEEPTEAAAIVMMRGLLQKLEKHHGVRILDEGLQEAVGLSRRYIAGRQLPDKAVSVLDTACARVALGQQATAAPIEDLRRSIEALDTEVAVLEREQRLGTDHAERLRAAREERTKAARELGALEERLKEEKALLAKIAEVRGRIEALDTAAAVVGAGGEATPPEVRTGDPEAAVLRAELASLKADLRRVQGEQPLIQPEVDGQAIAEVVSSWTGIPVGRMLTDEIQTLLQLERRLAERVIGQEHALHSIAQRIRTSRASLENPSRPIGVFLLVGPSGVGKTETALALADALYGGERNMVTINMSEYQESHTVSKLKGSPPGYVGYGEGGVLTEAVRRRPYSVVLLDEVEKAHPDVLELFYQVFDRGMLEDGEGREIDFKNTVILLTSNAGTDPIVTMCADPETRPEPGPLAEALRPALQKVFPPALLGRLILVPFYPLTSDVMEKIIRLQLDRVARRVRENQGAGLEYSEDVVRAVAAKCTEPESGARSVDHVLTRSLLPDLAGEYLSRLATGQPYSRVRIGVGEKGDFLYQID